MKFPVLWLSFVSVWAGTEKVICLAWDFMSRSHVTLRLGAKVAMTKQKHFLQLSVKKVIKSSRSISFLTLLAKIMGAAYL